MIPIPGGKRWPRDTLIVGVTTDSTFGGHLPIDGWSLDPLQEHVAEF